MDTLLLALRLLLVILLYAFLAAILLMLWRDLRQTAPGREAVRQTAPGREAVRPGGQLVILEAADGAPVPGTVFPLQPVTSIGRSPGNTVPIPDTYVSAQHALLTWREGQWWVEDLDSRNGTLLNGTRISGPTIVSAGDVIGVGLGHAQLKLELE